MAPSQDFLPMHFFIVLVGISPLIPDVCGGGTVKEGQKLPNIKDTCRFKTMLQYVQHYNKR